MAQEKTFVKGNPIASKIQINYPNQIEAGLNFS